MYGTSGHARLAATSLKPLSIYAGPLEVVSGSTDQLLRADGVATTDLGKHQNAQRRRSSIRESKSRAERLSVGRSAMTVRASAARKLAVHHNEEVRRRFEKAATAGEQATRQMGNTYLGAGKATIEFHQRALAIAQSNVDSAFDC